MMTMRKKKAQGEEDQVARSLKKEEISTYSLGNRSIRIGKDIQRCPSPLRYPGGKARAIRQILKRIPENTSTVVSPFFGGGSVEIALACLGVNVRGYDLFAPAVSFWQEALKKAKKLAETVNTYRPLSKKEFRELQQATQRTRFERAVAFFLLNRTSYGGGTYSGGYTGDRLTDGSVNKLKHFKCPNLSVDLADFRDSLEKHKDDFLYLDPPYYLQPNPLYGKSGSTHKGFPHKELSEILLARENWLLSYDDCPEIRELYSDCKIVKPKSWGYSLAAEKDRNFRDILITRS